MYIFIVWKYAKKEIMLIVKLIADKKKKKLNIGKFNVYDSGRCRKVYVKNEKLKEKVIKTIRLFDRKT